MLAEGFLANQTSCLNASLGRPVLGPSMKDTFAEFGYDSRKDVGACDHGPSGLAWEERKKARRFPLQLLA